MVTKTLRSTAGARASGCRACLLAVTVVLSGALQAGDDGKVKIQAEADIADGVQSYTVSAPGYTAKLSADGQILSVKLGALDVFDGAISIGVGGKNEKPDFVKQLGPQTFQLNYPSRPVATLSFGEQSITIVIKQQKKTWDFGLWYTVAPRAQTVSSKGRGFEHLALPLLSGRTAYDDVAFTFDDGSVLRVAQAGPGNHINADENGWVGGYGWGRKCLEVGGTYTYVFTFEKGAAGTKKLAAPPFVLRHTRTGNIYAAGEPVALNLELRPALCQKLSGVAEDLVIECRTRDLWGQQVDVQEFPLDFAKLKGEAPAAAGGAQSKPADPSRAKPLGQPARPVLVPVQLQLRKKGWLETKVTLKDKQGRIFPTSEVTALSVVTPTEGLLNPPMPEKAGTYEYNAFLGLTCHREGINLEQIFPLSLNTERPSAPSDIGAKAGADAVKDLALEEKKADTKAPPKELAARWDDLDRQMAASVEAQKKYGCTVFWLMEPPQKWWLLKDPARVEQALFQIVDRYKDRNKYWMLVNEPNLSMSPKDYVNNYLLPLNRAAKKADPDAKVFGPDTCGLNPGWLEEVYKASAATGTAGGTADIVDMHPYTGHHRGWEEHGMADTWKKVRETMAAHGDGQKEMWSTESGFDWSLGRLGKNHHAKHIVRQYPIAASVGIPKNHFFLYYTCFVGYHKMYLVEYDQTLLPGGVAARVQSEQLVGTEFAGREEIGKDKHCYLYRGKDCDVRLAWSHDFATSFAAGVASRKIAVADMMGNQIADYPPSAPARQNVTFQISGYPIYIRLDKGAVFEPAKEDLGPNLARQDGVKVTASSEEKPGIAKKVVDGVWNSENTGSYEDRLWVAAAPLAPHLSPLAPHPSSLAWLEIAMPQKQAVGRVHVYAPSSVCGMAGLRSFKVLAFDDGKQDWTSVGEVKDSEEAWVFHLTFDPLTTDRIRLLITDLNNGFKLDDKTPYTDMKPRVSEVEIYAPSKR
ncbi:MAG: hypothetical protein NTW87_15625 [Planctomycetota bacterium]|nr:hypothetical protein [Planctomycetota bacterium]